MIKNKIRKSAEKLLIGFVGQGYIGKNYADDFEKRGYKAVRYALEKEFSGNKEKIKNCDMVFIAVPTPTTPRGFDDSLTRQSIALVPKGKIAIIKSTILPGTTKSIQKDYPGVFIFHSPEFLSESTAAFDAANPERNIIGLPIFNKTYKAKAELVMSVLPHAPFKKICSSEEAELIKYIHNINGYIQVVFANIIYDLGKKLGTDWSILKEAILADPLMSHTYLNPVHKKGRGAGGRCFIKDFAAFSEFYKKVLAEDREGITVLKSLADKNNRLLLKSGKDMELLRGVYGEVKSKKIKLK